MNEEKRIPKDQYFILRYWNSLDIGDKDKAEYYAKRLVDFGYDVRQLCRSLTAQEVVQELGI